MSEVDLAALVRANILEVLESVEQSAPIRQPSRTVADDGYAASDSAAGYEAYVAANSLPVIDASYSVVDACSICEIAPTAGSGLDPEVLEIPNNSDATIRLLKARVKALNEQVQLLQTNSEGRHSAALPNKMKDVFEW